MHFVFGQIIQQIIHIWMNTKIHYRQIIIIRYNKAVTALVIFKLFNGQPCIEVVLEKQVVVVE